MNPIQTETRLPQSAGARKPIRATENQKKVIQDKYLRDDPTIETWIDRVAANVALAEILYSGKVDMWKVWDGVSTRISNAPTKEGASTRLVLLHHGLATSKERDHNFAQYLGNLKKTAAESPEAKALVNAWADRFYNMLANWYFLPNSPTLMNAGRDLQQLSACYVLPVEDSMEGITSALKSQALIHKSGGGTGFSFQRLRPSGDEVKTTRGVASGAISFMQVFDKMTDVVKQGGTRRGANMGILPYWHPEIVEFITMKSKPGVMENFNVSVTIDEKFMRAVETGEDYDLLNPRTMEPVGKANARKIFDMMAEFAWRSGDPGVIMIDRINNSQSNPTPQLGQIESTNPCGEQPLLPNEPCNLGSINVANFVKGDITEGEVDWERLAETVALAVRFLDDVIDVNNYPLPEIEQLSKGNRRIGLGVMGWAETLVKLGIAYDSEESLAFARQLMKFVNEKALEASEDLARERGAFPNWKNSIFDPRGPHFRGAEKFPRHCARTTIAPTGTIGLAAGLQGAGIEPFFALTYTRYNAKALEAVKKDEKPDDKDVFYEVNPLFREIARRNGFFGLKEEDLWQKVSDNHKSVRGVAEIPQDVQTLFPSSHDISVPFHVKIQAAFQEHTDNAVSKTINMPNTATVEDVKHAYLLAYELGCKGITIYRDGSKSHQVLNLTSGGKTQTPAARDSSRGVASEYYEIRTGQGPLHIHIDYDEAGPYRVFTNLPPVGTELSGLTAIIGILLSKYLEAGGDPKRVLKHLNSIKSDRSYGFGAQRVDSIPHAIAIALRNHLQKTNKLDPASGEAMPPAAPPKLELWDQSAALYCPKCYSSNVARESGCSGVTCHDCGHSECS